MVLIVGTLVLVGLQLRPQNLIGDLETISSAALSQATQKALASPAAYDPDYLIALAEKIAADSSDQDAVALRLVHEALERNPQTPFGWALVAFLETRLVGELTPAGETALQTSIDLCRLCDEDLIKWRLEFVMSYWDVVDEEIRLAVFEGADLLRWWHLDYKYLEDARALAEQADIPFRRYQSLINTPVRPQEVGRTPQN